MPSLDLLHQLECRACPLNAASCRTPKMPPSGAAEPIVYLLGQAPTAAADKEGEPFTGRDGEFIRALVPKRWRKHVRYNNVVRTHPEKNRKPEPVEIECCRPSIVRDIEQAQPVAIFGFGEVPLKWAAGQSGTKKWRGRRMPVRIGTNVCWYYVFQDPEFLFNMRRGKNKDFPSEFERAFEMDVKRAFQELENDPGEPFVMWRAQAEDAVEWVTGHKPEDLDYVLRFLQLAAEEPYAGIDYETNGKRPYSEGAAILTAAVSIENITLAFPFEHPQAGWNARQLELLRQGWVDFLLAQRPTKVVHQLAFEMEWTAFFFGRDKLRAGRWGDSMSQAFVLDERVGDSKPGCLGLEFLVQQHFGFNLKSLSPLNRKKLAQEPLEDVLRYNGMDAKFHRLLFLHQQQLLQREGLLPVYEMQLRRIPTVVLTQMKGVPLDQKVVAELQDKYEERLEQIADEIAAMAAAKDYRRRFGTVFNPLGNDDVAGMLKDILKETKQYDALGGFSVDKEVLSKIDHPICKAIIRYREANKRLSTYILPMRPESEIVYPDGLLHPILNTTFSEGGRLSSEDPNEQNFPKRDGEAREVRRQIRPAENEVVAAFDHGQIEARVIGMASRDKVFVRALWEDYDVHMEWAERISREYPARVGGKKCFSDKGVMKNFRTDVKNQWTFPLFFGAHEKSVAEYLKIPLEVLQPLVREFWKMFEGVAEWQERLWKGYEEKGYVECLTGRRRRAPLSRNQVFNSPIQGTACDIVVDGMNRLSEMEVWMYQANMNIHDDLTFMLPADRIDECADVIITEMLDVRFDFINVPLQVEMSIGDDWEHLEEVGKFNSHKWLKGRTQ